MSAIVGAGLIDGNNRVNMSDIETARNIGLDDDVFPPVEEVKEESSRVNDRRDQFSD